MSSKEQIAQVLAGLAAQQQPQAPIDPSMVLASLPQGMPQQSPMAQPQDALLADPALEAQAQAQGQLPLHPLVQTIAQHLGLMNYLRNRSNQQMIVDPNRVE